MSNYIKAEELSDEHLREILVPSTVTGPEHYNRSEALRVLLERAKAQACDIGDAELRAIGQP